MRAWLLRLWAWPWPGFVRRAVGPLIEVGVLQAVLIPHFRVGVVALLRDEEQRYLLFRHTYRSSRPWGLPTGFLEHGEQPDAALRREIREESSLVAALDPVWSVYVAPGHVVNLVFRGVIETGTFRPSTEVSEARWFSSDAIPPLMPGQAELIRAWESEDGRVRTA